MTAAISCPLPGCSNSTPAVGVPCADCQSAFGGLLVETDRVIDEVATAAALEERDAGVRLIMAERRWAMDETPYSKAMQLCWLCEQRRTCTRTPNGWECGQCREVI